MYGYDYVINTNKVVAWAQVTGSQKKIDFFAAAELSYTNYYRDGKMKNGLLLLMILSFFGVVRVAFDIFRTDILIELLALFIYFLIKQNKTYLALFIFFTGLFIHEAIYFLVIPIVFLFKV